MKFNFVEPFMIVMYNYNIESSVLFCFTSTKSSMIYFYNKYIDKEVI